MTDAVDISELSDPAELLALLHGVQAPEVSSWPAPGWWFVLLFIVVVVTALMAVLRVRSVRRQVYEDNAWRREALAELDELRHRLPVADDAERLQLVRSASTLLRRVMMHGRGRKQVACLTDQAWWDELNTLDANPGLDASLHTLLLDAPYRTAPDEATNASDVERLLSWMHNAIVRLPSGVPSNANPQNQTHEQAHELKAASVSIAPVKGQGA